MNISPENSKQSPLFVLTLKLGEKQQQLPFYINEDPRQVALKFCQEQGLEQRVALVLEQRIKENLQTKQEASDSEMPNFYMEDDKLPFKQSSWKYSGNRHEIKGIRQRIVENESFQSRKSAAQPSNRIYYKGMQLKLKREARTKKMQQDQQVLENQSLTFKPKINRRELKDERRAFTPTSQHLLNKGIEKTLKINQKREEQLKLEMANCTFSPKINKKSRNLSQPDWSQYLYKDAIDRKERKNSRAQQKQASNSQYQFKPDLSLTSNQKRFRKILSTSIDKFDSKIDGLSPVKNKSVDAGFSQGIFDTNSNSFDSIDIGHNSFNSIPRANPRKLKQLQTSKYKSLYNALRKNVENPLNFQNLQIENLSLEAKLLLQPVFSEAKRSEMDFRAFVGKLEQVLAPLTRYQKRIVFAQETSEAIETNRPYYKSYLKNKS